MEEMLFKHPSNGLENRAWVQPEAQASKRIHPLSKVEEIAEDKVAEEEAPQATAINKQAYHNKNHLTGIAKEDEDSDLAKAQCRDWNWSTKYIEIIETLAAIGTFPHHQEMQDLMANTIADAIYQHRGDAQVRAAAVWTLCLVVSLENKFWQARGLCLPGPRSCTHSSAGAFLFHQVQWLCNTG